MNLLRRDRPRLRRGSAALAASALVGSSVLAAIAGAAPAHADGTQHVDATATYDCHVFLLGTELTGTLLPGPTVPITVESADDVPVSVAPGDTIPASQAHVTLTLPEAMRSSAALLGATQAEGHSEDSAISITADGLDTPLSVTIANLGASLAPIPQTAGDPWSIATVGDVPAITVPDSITAPGTATLHMPGSFDVESTLADATGAPIGGTDAVTMNCAIDGDDTLGTIAVTAPQSTNTPPTAGDVSATTDENNAVGITLDGADADGDALTYTYEQPSNGTVTGTGPDVTYTPDPGFSGSDNFGYTVSDGQASASGTVSITVNAATGTQPPSGTNSEQLSVTVPQQTAPGEFTWAIDGTNGLVDLGTATEQGDHFEATGSLNPVRVTDTRSGAPAWSISGEVSDFTTSSGTSFPGKYLGWTPEITQAGGGATAGDPVASGFDSGDGLSAPATLASAAAGHDSGSAELGAGLDLKLPLDTGDGTYQATVTLTALS